MVSNLVEGIAEESLDMWDFNEIKDTFVKERLAIIGELDDLLGIIDAGSPNIALDLVEQEAEKAFEVSDIEKIESLIVSSDSADTVLSNFRKYKTKV